MNKKQEISGTDDDITTVKRSGMPRVQLMFTAVLLFSIGVLVVTTRPSSGGPIVLLMFLGLVFLLLLNVVYLTLKLLTSSFGLRFGSQQNLVISVSLVVGGIVLLGLQTLGQLGVVDVFLVIFLEALLLFYVLRRF